MFTIFHSGYNFGIPDEMNHFDARFSLVETKAVASKDVPVAFGVQVGKTASKFEFIASNLDRAVCRLTLCLDFVGKIFAVDAQELAHACLFKFKVARYNMVVAMVNHEHFLFAENILEHIEEMYADVGCQSARLCNVAFPRIVEPLSA